MAKHTVTAIKDFDISKDGRTVILNFADENDRPVSLKMSTMALDKASHEMGIALTQARKLSEVSKQGIIAFMRPKKCRAELLNDQPLVAISFGLPNGLEVHYGIPTIDAVLLARQILAAAEHGMSAKPPPSH